MSKGWESKSVEEQQAEASSAVSAAHGIQQEENAVKRLAEAEKKRKIQALELQREHVLSQRTSSPHRRSALEMALASIEYELEQLGWSIKI